MALDSKEKRQNAIGVGRPYLRNHFPVATPDAQWRAASGLGYGVSFAAFVPAIQTRAGFIGRNVGRMMGRG